MTESKQDRYFVDGFMIRHFNIFPAGFDKENLFEEQKVFLIYLIGVIPDLENWKMNVGYKLKLNAIKKLKNVKVNQTEIDIAQISGKSLDLLKKEKLISEKKKRIKELNVLYRVEEDEDDIDEIVKDKTEISNDPSALWDMLQGKGLTKNGL